MLGFSVYIIITFMNKIICSGALFYALQTKRFLFLHRSSGKRSNLWGLVGGTNEVNETPFEGLRREITEEIGFYPDIKKTIPLETFVSVDSNFCFHTYFCIIQEEFIPNLNNEHNGYAWVSLNHWPKPLHQGLKNTLNNKVNKAKIETVVSIF